MTCFKIASLSLMVCAIFLASCGGDDDDDVTAGDDSTPVQDDDQTQNDDDATTDDDISTDDDSTSDDDMTQSDDDATTDDDDTTPFDDDIADDDASMDDDATADDDSTADDDIADDDTTGPEIVFDLDAGYRLNFASNPRIISYKEGVLGLGYEYKSPELINNPSERGYIAFSTDGLEFTGARQFEPGENRGPGIRLADGTYRRYTFFPDKCGFVGEHSQDGASFVEEGVAFDLTDQDCKAGVYTVFVDAGGGVNLLFNSNVKDETTGQETIFVRKGYSTDNGVSFTYVDDDVLEQQDSQGRIMSMADPNALTLADGRVLLVVMNQNPDEPKPPLGRVGDIYGFLSDDGIADFQPIGMLFSWADFTEFEVRSLNDPKLFQFDDGLCKIYVAAMIPIEEGETYDNDNKYVIVSASWQPD